MTPLERDGGRRWVVVAVSPGRSEATFLLNSLESMGITCMLRGPGVAQDPEPGEQRYAIVVEESMRVAARDVLTAIPCL